MQMLREFGTLITLTKFILETTLVESARAAWPARNIAFDPAHRRGRGRRTAPFACARPRVAFGGPAAIRAAFTARRMASARAGRHVVRLRTTGGTRRSRGACPDRPPPRRARRPGVGTNGLDATPGTAAARRATAQTPHGPTRSYFPRRGPRRRPELPRASRTRAGRVRARPDPRPT